MPLNAYMSLWDWVKNAETHGRNVIQSINQAHALGYQEWVEFKGARTLQQITDDLNALPAHAGADAVTLADVTTVNNFYNGLNGLKTTFDANGDVLRAVT